MYTGSSIGLRSLTLLGQPVAEVKAELHEHLVEASSCILHPQSAGWEASGVPSDLLLYSGRLSKRQRNYTGAAQPRRPVSTSNY